MKKLLSLILSICMLSAFAFSVSAATLPTGIKLAVTETETGAVAEISVAGSYVGLSSIQAVVNFDTAKLTYDTTEYETFNKWDTKSATANAAGDTYIVKIAALTDTDADFLTGANTKVMTVKFNKIGSATLAKGDIKLITSVKIGRTPFVSEAYCGADKTSSIALDNDSFTAYVPAGKDPVITVDESAKTGANNGVINVVTGTEGNYSVTVKAPIGKTPVLVVGGTNIPMTSVGGADYSYAGQVSADATIKVIYEDVAATVITYPIVYQDANCAVVFGKGTIAEGDKYGIQVTDTIGESKDCEAKANVGGIFGVAFNYVNAAGETAPNGTYKAKAFVGSEYGEEITFTK